MKNVAVISLGCDKNRVDTERMLFRIARGGYGISDVEDADVIIINTCAFIESARQESIDTILECAEYKKSGKCKKIIVTGCLPQRYLSELVKELPEVDAFLGTYQYDAILDAIEGGDITLPREYADDGAFCKAENVGRLLTTYPHTAYIKIAEGCDNHCTFCAIPSIRGGYRSRPLSDVLTEAKGLAADGVKEYILVAQDVTRYGEDRGKNSLIELLDGLEDIVPSGGLIRLLYCYPERVTDELIDKISRSDKIAKYIDMPIQHASDKILKLMNRRTTREQMESRIDALHKNGIVVRTSLMVGFPGESDEDFDALCEFVERVRPEYAGVFAYSKEDGTAAARLPDQIQKSVKKKRVDALGKACMRSTRAFNKSNVGKTLKVLYEDIDYDKDMFSGRAAFMAPDVDGRVYFTSNVPVNVGGVYDVHITDHDDYDLYGEVISELTE